MSSLQICRYVGCLSKSKAESKIKKLFDGVYLVREDDRKRGEYAICIKYKIHIISTVVFIQACLYIDGNKRLIIFQ